MNLHSHPPPPPTHPLSLKYLSGAPALESTFSFSFSFSLLFFCSVIVANVATFEIHNLLLLYTGI